MDIQHGIIDVHAHVIPGVDDGSRVMRESVSLLKRAAEQGIVGVIATPHYSRRRVLTGLKERSARVQEAIREIYPDFFVYPGQETFYHNELTDQLRAGEAYTMAGSRYVLVEFDPSVPYQELFQGIRKLLGSGYRPILAHMERYACLRNAGTGELLSCGCKLQMNYESLQGSWLSKETRWCRKQVETGVIHLLGTDMHRMNYRPPQITESMKWLQCHVSPDYLDRLTRRNALHIINQENIR